MYFFMACEISIYVFGANEDDLQKRSTETDSAD